VIPPPRRVSAIVLAGGRSSRFGRDKLAEPIDGEPLLHRAIAAVRPVATEIVVVAAPDALPSLPDAVRWGYDRRPFEGPLAGLVAGLEAAGEPIAIVVGGDSPSLVPGVLEALLDRLDAPGVQAVALEHDGRTRPLPVALSRAPATIEAAALFEGGERRLRAILDRLVTDAITEPEWRALDPEAATLRDVDTPDDVHGPPPGSVR
jgi:molybdenum cofactor guanylyltransferase